MTDRITQAREALKTSRKYILGAYEWTFPHEDENEAALRSVDEAIAALSSAAPSAASEPVAPEHDVRKIMVAVVPGDDGMGREVYAKSVDEVVDLLTRMSEELEDLKRAAPPAPALSAAGEREALTDEQILEIARKQSNTRYVRQAHRFILEFARCLLAARPPVPEEAKDAALTGFTTQEIIEACDAAGIDDREFRRLMSALKVKAEDTQATTEFDVEMDQALAERDEREGVINSILDEVLGQDRHEWSSSYGFADAIEDVKTRMWALTRPPAPEEAKDAARYRWLRDNSSHIGIRSVTTDKECWLQREEADMEVDAVMARAAAR